jgi:hypothetical protein
MTTRKGRGVSSLNALDEKRKEEKNVETGGDLSRQNRVLKDYKEGTLKAVHQRICEIIFSTVQEGESGVIVVTKLQKDEGITPFTFRNALNYLEMLGYIEILPVTSQYRLGGTMIKVLKKYKIPPPSERMMAVYEGLKELRSGCYDGETTEVTLLELGLLTGLTLNQLKKNLLQLAFRRYITIFETDETEDTLKFCFTGQAPPTNENNAQKRDNIDTE